MSSYLIHYGVQGMKWGVRRYQNEDGSLTKIGKKRYEKTVSDAKEFGNEHAQLERMTRVLTRGTKPGTQILVPPNVKKEYSERIEKFMSREKLLRKKYKDIQSEIVSMDDGFDYVVTLLSDDRLGGAVEYYSLVGKTNKE